HAAAEAVDKPAVPPRRRRGRGWRRQRAYHRIMQDVDDIGRTVDDALLLPDDQWNLFAFVGLGRGDVVRARAGRNERLPDAAPIGIEILDCGGRRATPVLGRIEAMGFVLANEWLLLGSGKQRAVQGMIDEGEASLLAARLCDQGVVAILESINK